MHCNNDWTVTFMEEAMIIIIVLDTGRGGTAGMVPRGLRDRQGYQDNQEHQEQQGTQEHPACQVSE